MKVCFVVGNYLFYGDDEAVVSAAFKCFRGDFPVAV